MTKAQTGADLKAQFEPLSEADIQASTDDASFRKGYDYYLNRSIIEPTLSESVLRAFCHGSNRNPYRVEATLLPAGQQSVSKLAATSCSCPRGGFCKHLVALLLTWLHQPEGFIVRSGLMARLSMKTHEELLALLEQLIQRQYEIEPLIEVLMELPLAPTAEEEKQQAKGREYSTVDPSAIRSQVDLAFDNAGERWDSASDVAYDLERIYDIGKSFAQAGQWANALVVYATIAQETVRRYEEIQHDQGEVSSVMGECAAGLVACLNAQFALPQDEQLDEFDREELLTALFDLWKFRYDYGGVEVNIPGAVAEHATKQERASVEEWLRQEMEQGKDSSRNSRVVNFLVMLKQAGDASDEEILEEYRNADLSRELTEKLLAFGRTNEALGVAQANLTESRDVTWFAEQLLKLDEVWREQALAFVETRLKQTLAARSKPQDYARTYAVDNYRQWLSQKYLLYGQTQQALDMELARFQVKPDETNYHSVRSAAQATSQPEAAWSALRPQLIQTLEQHRRWDELVSIYLKEGEVSQALSALAEQERTSPTMPYSYGYRAGPNRYQVQVAKAAEEQYPDEAIRLYKSIAQTLISGKTRETYQQATGYLTRIKALYQKQEQEPEWHTYITNLRKSNKSLRALKEELDKKGL